ncbi:hypothetical protein THAOC_29549 [Thalassiosira oceanica]|uniref:DoxX family protein n=1 Tax=Thalassiosira oceanica TaxID=159749 RepID=K0RDL6_THAOC|nr:hypothetical protein THAOC_29549 [Thalassiosira oceanica]|eukprot:EJK51290.1 hypothetical protein THAOC_29549 [Thalassiosira oceanica]
MKAVQALLSLTALATSQAFTTPMSARIAHSQLSPPTPSTTALSVFEGAPEEEIPPELTAFAETLTDVSILGLRLGTCALMVHHGVDKLDHVEGFSANVVARFFGFLPGPPAFWTVSAAATQVAGAGLLAVGVLARPVALSMMATMVVAVTFHLLNTGAQGFPLGVPAEHSYNFELAAMYVGVLAYFAVAGAGAYSVDEKLLGGELQFYQRALGKVFSKDE